MAGCTHCKLKLDEYRIYSSETAILTAAEEEEYNILKKHETLNKSLGCLQAKCPSKKDPAILVNNGKEAKSCQISQERWQLKNNTHSWYVKQLRDVVERIVVSKLTQAAMSAYSGPINYITDHEV